MQPFTIELFTSANTSFRREIKARNMQSAINKARKYYSNHWPIVIKDAHQFAKLEKGAITEASSYSLINA